MLLIIAFYQAKTLQLIPQVKLEKNENINSQAPKGALGERIKRYIKQKFKKVFERKHMRELKGEQL